MQHVIFMDVRSCAFPPEGVGRFGAAWWSSEGAVRRSSVTARVSTADSTLSPLAHCIRLLTDLIDFAWGDPEVHHRSVRSVGSDSCVHASCPLHRPSTDVGRRG